MTTGMNLINLYQNEYSLEERINENFKKVDSFLTLSVKERISSSKIETIDDVLYLIEPTTDDFFSDKVGQIACHNANFGWFFYKPKDGSICFLQSEKKFYFYSENEWKEMQNGEGGGADVTGYLKQIENLSDLQNISSARSNLDVYSKSETYSKNDVYNKEEVDEKILEIETGGEIDFSSFVKSNNNLSDLQNISSARSNLDVYSKDETYSKNDVYNKEEVDEKISNIPSGDGADTDDCLKKDNNLSDLSNKNTARSNLDVYSKSETFCKTENLKDIIDQDAACHNIGTLRDWEIHRLGDYKISAVPYDHDTWYICNGRELARDEYKDLFDLIGTSFGKGNGKTTFNLPDFRNRTIWGADNNLNNIIDSGLPNINGEINLCQNQIDGSNGAFSLIDGKGHIHYADKFQGVSKILFNAKSANPIYGRSDIVQPPVICVNIFIKVKW